MKPAIIVLVCFLFNALNATVGMADDSQPTSAPAGQLVIVKAEYGDLATDVTNDVTKKVAKMVKNNTLTVVAENISFGDPAEGVQKKLKVDYIMMDGKAASQTVAEGETLKISADVK
jgi:hypothetical protein